MAKRSGLGQGFSIDGTSIVGDVGSIETCSTRAAVLDVTALDKSAMERIQGLADSEITFKVFFNDAASQEHATLKTLPTTDRTVLWTLGSGAGVPTATLVAKQINYDWNRNADGSLEGTIQCLANGAAITWGVTV